MTAARLGIAVVAVAYVGYLALLVTCDLRRVAPPGFIPLFESRGVIVGQLQAGSIGARAGLQAGDRIRQANGQVLEGSGDWERVRVHLDPSKPLDLEIERAGRSSAVSLLLTSGLREWRTGPARPALLAFRLAQVITLAFALVVAFKRYSQPSALLGAVLLASLATVSLILPMRMVAFWHALPPVLAALLWVPFATSVAVGPLLFAFFAVFPRRVLSTARLGLAVLPAVLIVGWHVYAWHRITQDLGPPTGLADWLMGVFAINVIYAGFAVALLFAHRRSVDTLTDQRRIRVLIAGGVLGVGAGAAVVIGHWRNPGT
ncbi:MAG TPA: PDZ domain-containing protein, partial [Vicinamibacterales bacterium]|nr:PDZ domain-containing protein [Vicinamibacterales bacterium]